MLSALRALMVVKSEPVLLIQLQSYLYDLIYFFLYFFFFARTALTLAFATLSLRDESP